MAGTDALTPLLPADAAQGLALSAEAGWNQGLADWQMMLALGRGYALRDGAGGVRASGLALPMGPGAGWISMILVTPSLRRQGHATRLMQACLVALEGAGRVPFLDATPAGQPLYAGLGFAPVLPLRRMTGGGGGTRPAPDVRPAGPGDLDWIAAMDRAVLGVDRRAILHDLMGRPGALALACADHGGFALGRRGRLATQIGPILADTPRAALALLDTALAATPGPVIIDVAARHPLAQALEASGFTEQRPFLRMARGLAGTGADSTRMAAAAGPELG